MPSRTTQEASRTRPRVISHCITTPPAQTIRPQVITRFIITPAAITSRWALVRAQISTGSNNIDIGNAGVAGEGSKIRIGTQGTQNGTFIAGIFGVAGSGSQVVSTAGKLGVVASSVRFKEAIKPMDKASESILALNPVTFRYKQELDADRIPQFGLLADDVEKVNPDLVVRDADGKIRSVRYEAVNAMLLNEFMKEHRKVEKLEATVEGLAATVKEQAAQIQKVSAQLETSKPAPQMVNNP